MKNHLSLYIEHHAEKHAVQTAQFISDSKLLKNKKPFQHCIIIPAYNESIEFIRRIEESQLSKNNTLLIVIVNQPNNLRPTSENHTLWSDIKVTAKLVLEKNNTLLVECEANNSHILAIDHFTHGNQLPIKQGVGLARKIGCDIACSLIQKKIINSKWIHTSDADTTLPSDYLNQLPEPDDNSNTAAVYAYKHEKNSNCRISEATLLYEKSLHYYVDGLRYAGSAYAYHSLGSCIAINVEAYAKVRGFPKRAGGEDFYLLNKLRKLGSIKQLTGKPLLISARLSMRVPFGTGPAVEKIIERGLSKYDYPYYNPKIFSDLRKVILHFKSLFSMRLKLNEWLNDLTSAQKNALIEIGIESLFKHIETQTKNEEQCNKHIINWFDAFRTLKFIHILDGEYDRMDLNGAVNQLKKKSV